MRNSKFGLITLLAGILLWHSVATSDADEATTAAVATAVPETVIWDGAHMSKLRAATDLRSPDFVATLAKLQSSVDEAKKRGPFSVTSKKVKPPSGDIHDYMSFSRYWWPNPDTEDGLPYIRKDGQVNRKLVEQGDREPLGDLVDTSEVLSLAYYFFDDQEAGKAVVNRVETWFLNPATRMNPNLNFGQAVPGRAEGRGAGIIDTRGFMRLLDALALLDESVGWDAENKSALQSWFKEYGNWLRTNRLGVKELNATNNHGSWYAAQVARYALYCGDLETARATVEGAKQKRLEQQFDKDGYQAAEIKRTLSLHYSMFNLSALVTLARIGQHPDVDIDLWSHIPSHGCGLERAHKLLVPFISGDREWQFEQLTPYKLSRSSHLALRLVSNRYQDISFQELARKVPIKHGDF